MLWKTKHASKIGQFCATDYKNRSNKKSELSFYRLPKVASHFMFNPDNLHKLSEANINEVNVY